MPSLHSTVLSEIWQFSICKYCPPTRTVY